MSVDAILKEAEALSLEERAELVHRLEAGLIEAGWEPAEELTDEMKTLLDQRIAAYEADPNKVYNWEEVVEHVKRNR